MLNVVGLFCEDIRDEKTGQATLVGLLPDTINVPSLPQPAAANPSNKGMLPKIGLYVRINADIDDSPGAMTLKLVFSNGHEIEIGKAGADVFDRSIMEAQKASLPFAGVLMAVVMAPLMLPALGLVTAVLDTEKAGRKVCGALNIAPQT